ncbi:extracellular solute-binding protein [Microbaculum marinisediminis]|uniref:Extracellular solute-binding protein n=1 Tax=Microbaculum marinisediminis TaxID=2931392 RepID=A0AAW5QX35_9HYPH|nr:extracellular solute-binding protein [Microbaculum sp. A6E488]MCT8970850.1 extracellular solute-binding protein [Microbaculum sp. A6E488]
MAARGLTRRDLLAGAAALGGVAGLGGRPATAQAVASERLHGLSVFGNLKYPAGFAQFDYVVPDAPKGGVLAMVPSSWAFNQNPQTFNTLNTLILKGDAPVGLHIIFDTLMVRAFDEPDAVYGLVAEGVEISADRNTYRFFLRPEARWHDGTALTAADVEFSLNTLKQQGHPLISQTIREMVGARAVGDHEVAVTFTGKQARDLAQTVATLPIISRAYYQTQPFDQTTMQPPLASGPYRVGKFDAGRYIDYDRVADYWARDLPVVRGQYNFDTLRYEFYRDRDVAFEAFKAGRYFFREEFTSRVWATGYDFPAVDDGRVTLATIADDTPSGAQGWFLNTRRQKFADPRVREALIYAFDFEWTNRTLFYDLYRRSHSYFQNSDMMAEGPPSEAELALLEPWRGKVPDEVFGAPFTPPVSDGSGQDRKLLRHATRLLKEAGWSIDGGALKNAAGETLTIEFLDNDGSFERVVQPYIRNLKVLGIEASFRIVDASQYQSRLNDFDYDLITRRYSMSPTPGEGIKQFWTSPSATVPGSNNLSGIADPAIDALTDIVINAETRDEQVTAARALDRLLRAGRYWVPHWYKAVHNLAYWDVYDRPEEKPRYARGVVETWWLNADRAAKLGKGV